MKGVTEQNHFLWLTLSLIALMFAISANYVVPPGFGHVIIKLFTLLTFFVTLQSVGTEHSARNVFRFILAAVVVVFILDAVFPSRWLGDIYLVLMALFFARAIQVSARQVLLTGSIDLNKIIGSIAIYMLLGLIWAIFYLLILEFSPEAFNGIEAAPWEENFSRVVYYSFVTLTTLGYGDISPRMPVAEVFVYLEAIVGIFYMAIVVASLVSAGLAGASSKSDSH